MFSSVESINIFQPPSQLTKKYITIKIDDFPQGNNVSWSWFFNYTLNATTIDTIGFKADIGVIGSAANNSAIQDFIAKYIASPNYEVFFHGWNHTLSNGSWDFGASKSFEQMDEEFNLFHQYMQQHFNYSNVITIGPPANDFARSNYTNQFYRAVVANGYKIVFFSRTSGDTGDGQADMGQAYCNSENFSTGAPVPLNADAIISCINHYKDAQGVFLQLHPGYGGVHHIWNATTFGTLMTRIHRETGRVFIRATDYYHHVFIPRHPNYFLKNATRFLDAVFPGTTVHSFNSTTSSSITSSRPPTKTPQVTSLTMTNQSNASSSEITSVTPSKATHPATPVNPNSSMDVFGGMIFTALLTSVLVIRKRQKRTR